MSQMTGQTSYRTCIRQLANLAGFIMGVLADLPEEKIKFWIGHKTLLKSQIQALFEIPLDPFTHDRFQWEKFYLEYFNLVADFSMVRIPNKPSKGDWRLIFILQGLTLHATIAAMRKYFKIWVCAEYLDDQVTINARTSTLAYAVWVRVGDEPDAKYLGKSTRTADMEGKIGITLLERLVFGLKHFTETGKHLDNEGAMSFCTGSRGADGRVPGVCWQDGVNMNWFDVDRLYKRYGLRRAVS